MVIGEKAGEKPHGAHHNTWARSYLTTDVRSHCMPNPWVSLRRDQLIPVNKAVNKKEQLDKRAGGGGGKKACVFSNASTITMHCNVNTDL
jgi:hypothetical protein